MALSFQAIDLREVAENVVSDVQKQSKEENKPMELRVEASPDLPRYLGRSGEGAPDHDQYGGECLSLHT